MRRPATKRPPERRLRVLSIVFLLAIGPPVAWGEDGEGLTIEADTAELVLEGIPDGDKELSRSLRLTVTGGDIEFDLLASDLKDAAGKVRLDRRFVSLVVDEEKLEDGRPKDVTVEVGGLEAKGVLTGEITIRDRAPSAAKLTIPLRIEVQEVAPVLELETGKLVLSGVPKADDKLSRSLRVTARGGPVDFVVLSGDVVEVATGKLYLDRSRVTLEPATTRALVENEAWDATVVVSGLEDAGVCRSQLTLATKGDLERSWTTELGARARTARPNLLKERSES